MIISIDFDGTCVKHRYPDIGDDIGAVPVLKELIGNGHRLILFTMRGNQYLNDAIDWFKKNNISLYGIQVNPRQNEWTSSPKAHADLYIDDSALGCPLINDDFSKRPYVDWKKVRELLIEKNIIKI